jgi:FlaG/FlaF family flagellin (archaellin)
MEGKQHRALIEDCQAVSEVIGDVLMIAIVVLAFSSIAITIFSDKGVMNPPHTPRVDLQEKLNTTADTVQIFHCGGETIDLEAVKIVLSVNGTRYDFNTSDYNNIKVLHSNGNVSADDVLMLGDHIVIYLNVKSDENPEEIDLTNDSTVDMYFVYTPSQKVIQRVTLQNGNKEN